MYLMEKPKNHTIAHSFVMALMIVLLGIFINNLVFAVKDYNLNTHANFVQEYATIVRYELTNGRYDYNKSFITFSDYAEEGEVFLPAP